RQYSSEVILLLRRNAKRPIRSPILANRIVWLLRRSGIDQRRPFGSRRCRLEFEAKYDVGHVPPIGIGQVVTSSGASLFIRAIVFRVDVFGLRITVLTIGLLTIRQGILDLLDTDLCLVYAVVRKLELHICAGLGAKLRRRWAGDRIGPDFGFEFRKRKN